MAFHSSRGQYGSNIRNKTAAFQPAAQGPGSSGSVDDRAAAFTGRGYVDLKGKGSQYGRPTEGSKTEFRGKQAGVHINSEVVELCEIIESIGCQLPDGSFGVAFGDLFETYTRISNKLVGMLMRARKQGLLDFEGEMLFQRRDDDVIVRLLRSPVELREEIEKKKSELTSHHTQQHNLGP